MPKKICILEDDDGIREIVTIILEGESYQVEAFRNITSFMSRGIICTPDLYLLDVKLPDGNGLDVCNLLKSTTETSQIPVVMMSAHEAVYRMENSCKAEAFIAKPFDIFELLEKIKNIIEPN